MVTRIDPQSTSSNSTARRRDGSCSAPGMTAQVVWNGGPADSSFRNRLAAALSEIAADRPGWSHTQLPPTPALRVAHAPAQDRLPLAPRERAACKVGSAAPRKAAAID